MREDSDGTARHPTLTQLCCRGSPSEPVTSLRTGPTEATRLKKLALSPRGTRKRLPPERSLLPPGWLQDSGASPTMGRPPPLHPDTFTAMNTVALHILLECDLCPQLCASSVGEPSRPSPAASPPAGPGLESRPRLRPGAKPAPSSPLHSPLSPAALLVVSAAHPAHRRHRLPTHAVLPRGGQVTVPDVLLAQLPSPSLTVSCSP